MPRNDWHDDDYMTRERGYRDFDERHRDFGDDERRDRGAFFGGDREYGSRRRGLMTDESSGGRSSSLRERSYGPDDYRTGIPRDETERLIASNKVEGTPVYDRNGDRLGSIHNFMVDKFRGKVVYAVLKHGSGFLGLDDRYYPLDWNQLAFDPRLGGYRIDMVEEDLQRFGSWDRNERWRGSDFDRNRDMRRERYPDRGMSRMPW